MGASIYLGKVLSAGTRGCTIILPTAPSLLLDIYPNAEVAYSLRRLSSTYTGNLIRVRRSSDNTEQNIGYDANNVLDTAALLAFCGVGNGFVTTWYDQSGNANNATQSTATNQPQIVSSGAVLLLNSKPCLFFDGSLNPVDLLTLNSSISVSTTNNYNSFVGKRNATIYNLAGLNNGAADSYKLVLVYDNRYYLYNKAGTYIYSSSTDTTTSQLLLTGQNAAGTVSIFKNGSAIASTTASYNYPNSITTIGGGWFSLTGNLQEIVFYNSNQSTNRTGIESNINSYYSIYP